MEKKFIFIEGENLSFQNGKLVDAQKQETKHPYQCVGLNFPTDYFFIIIQKRCFVWNNKKKIFTEIPYEPIENSSTYFHTSTDGDEEGKGIVAFEFKKDGDAVIIGKSFLKIAENFYKIGNYAYQFVKGEIQQLCSCASFEAFSSRVEINTEKDGTGEEFVFEKKNHDLWQCVQHTRYGNCTPEPLPIFY